MNQPESENTCEQRLQMGKSHPWHGVPIGVEAPKVVTAYIELVPSDTVKYELDKLTGHLKVDRPQQYSNVCPTLYGLIPRTVCGEQVAKLCMEKAEREGIIGDSDPLDICVLSEKNITHGDILLEARPIGGLRLIDGGEADDKIIAVMKGDAVYENYCNIEEIPSRLLNRLIHYFLTYKNSPESNAKHCELMGVYGREESYDVIRRGQNDYHVQYSS